MRRWLHPALLPTLVLGCASPGDESGTDASIADGGSTLDARAIDAGDAAVEALAPDAPSDAPALFDAPSLFDANPSHWCDSQEFIFCADFDEYALAQGWDGTDYESASITVDHTAYTSSPYSFLASTSAVASGGLALGRLQKKVTDLTSEIQFAFDLRPEALDPAGAPLVVTTIELATALGTSIDTVNLVLRAGSASVDDVAPSSGGGAPFSASYPFAPPPLHGWTHVELDVALFSDGSVGVGTITLYLGGAATPAVDHVAMSPISQPALPFFFLGAGVTGPSAPVAVRFDNVTLDYQ